jgi:hypothetical protein
VNKKGCVSGTGGVSGRRKRWIERLPDSYILARLRNELGAGVEIPPALVELKRQSILITRARKQLKTVIKEMEA